MSPALVSACVRRLLLLVGVAFAALPAGSALADTTIGQVGGQAGFSALCGGVLGDTSYVVPPGGGVITSFSIQTGAGNDGALVQFLVLRPQEAAITSGSATATQSS